ncbi:MAG: type II toxin-antitoxin system RelE/ParE family toxin [Methylococcales symbiont of Iophon sp. n. MRB-2018]|nr:MAG: type II toxin-antitoxin system RelE/ParE family toxin [Methylococcales symbiont of Iophon sp. n. MRB-2018]KAF3979223.1 MAG: type II toxin-antitoxin system RelE/ParE family toxin [Methylococcales symbiont of Iophon sp. n. MRB-2018]
MITIAETESFLKKASKLLPKEDKENLILYLSEHPSTGDIIQGTGGIRKLRWAKGNKGKSGGFRVIYYFHNKKMPLYLLAIFSKNEKVNISTEEKHFLSKAVKELVTYWRYRQ